MLRLLRLGLLVIHLFLLKKELKPLLFFKYVGLQVLGGLCAILVVHFMFDMQLFQISSHAMRVEGAPWSLFASEAIATAGLIMTILFIRKNAGRIWRERMDSR
mgnify:CR=1 FL=1